jgi:hypothetical protein
VKEINDWGTCANIYETKIDVALFQIKVQNFLFCLSTEQQITNCRVKFPRGLILSLLSGMLNRKNNKIKLDARKLTAETIFLDDFVQLGLFLLSVNLACLLFFLSLT